MSQEGCAAASQMGGVWSSARTHALKAWALLSGLGNGRGFGSVFHHHPQTKARRERAFSWPSNADSSCPTPRRQSEDAAVAIGFASGRTVGRVDRPSSDARRGRGLPR